MNKPPTGGMVPSGASPLSRRFFLAAGAAAAASPLLLRMPATDAVPSLEQAETAPTDFGFPKADRFGRYVKHMTFPVAGSVWWTDTYGSCRDGCSRHHEGQDIFGRKRQHLIAAVSGTVVVLRHRKTGNTLYIRSDADGWYYGYLHINNDRPGTDDGHNAYSQAFAPHVALWSHVSRGQHIAYLGDSGNAETTSPHCHFEIRKPASSVWHSQAVNAKYSLSAAKASRSGSSGSSSSSASGVVAPSGRPPIRKGEGGNRVAALQRALNACSDSHLSRDGSFGPATELAVKRLQRWCHLTVDGVYGSNTQLMLQKACGH